MKKIILFDPSYGTTNLGDFIINENIMREMDYLFSKNYLVRFSSHSPLVRLYQVFLNGIIKRTCVDAELKFLGGANMIKTNLLTPNPDWSLNLSGMSLYRGAVAIGCGTAKNSRGVTPYTKFIYRRTLSSDYMHSVRDESTKILLESLGLKAINTGCPTLWSLSPEKCLEIPRAKSSTVVFTLTDYDRNIPADQALIDILQKNYSKVLFWPQGVEDLEYFKILKNTSKITLLQPSIEAYKKVLTRKQVDYVGTRLHAGIYAMQHGVRSIIVVVDDRARDMQKTCSLVCVERADLSSLEKKVNSNFTTNITVQRDNIELWKAQFTNFSDD